MNRGLYGSIESSEDIDSTGGRSEKENGYRYRGSGDGAGNESVNGHRQKQRGQQHQYQQNSERRPVGAVPSWSSSSSSVPASSSSNGLEMSKNDNINTHTNSSMLSSKRDPLLDSSELMTDDEGGNASSGRENNVSERGGVGSGRKSGSGGGHGCCLGCFTVLAGLPGMVADCLTLGDDEVGGEDQGNNWQNSGDTGRRCTGHR